MAMLSLLLMRVTLWPCLQDEGDSVAMLSLLGKPSR